MKRLLVLLVALASALALGQTLDKTKHVGYLVWSSEGPRGHLEQALLDAMRADGYVEGKNLVIGDEAQSDRIDLLRFHEGGKAGYRCFAGAHRDGVRVRSGRSGADREL